MDPATAGILRQTSKILINGDKDIEFEKGIKEINNYLKTPEFDLNG